MMMIVMMMMMMMIVTMTINAFFKGCAKELSKLADEGLSLLRAEAQLSCFHFLHKLSHVKISSSVSSVSGVSGSSSGSSSSSSISSSGVGDSTDAILSSFQLYLTKLQSSIVSSTSAFALCVVLSPLAVVMPSLVQRCVETLLLGNNMSATHAQDKAKVMMVM